MGYVRIDKGRKDTRILWRVSYRENGKVKKKEYLLSSKGQITYWLPVWYIFVGIINRSDFENELVKYWLKVMKIEDYVNWEWQGKKLKFTSKDNDFDLRQKYFRDDLKWVRERLDSWFRANEDFNHSLVESIYKPLERLWHGVRELEDYEQEKIKYISTNEYEKYFLSLVKYFDYFFSFKPCRFYLDVYIASLILWGVGYDCNDKATDTALKNESWIIKDNYVSNERNRLKHNKEVILNNIESINKKFAPEKRQDSLVLFFDKVLENHSLPIL